MFYGWRIVVVAMLALGLSNGLVSYSYGLLVLPLGTEFGANRMLMMWGLTASSMATVLISPFAGSLMDRRSARVLFSVGAVCLALGMSLIAVSRNVWEFILVFGLLMSVGATLLGPIGANTIVARWFAQRRGRALGITAIGTSLGGLLVPLLLQTLIDAYGWRIACLWMAAIALLLLLPPIWLVVRNRPADLGLQPDGQPGEGQPTGVASLAAGSAPPRLMTDATFWRIALAVGVLMATFTVILANLVPFAVGHGVAARQAALLISIIAVAGISGKLLFSVFADRIDLKWAMLVALVMLGLPMVALTSLHSYPVMVLSAVSMGLASGAFLPAWSALVARIYGPSIFGRVMGRMQPIAIVMVMLAMPMSGHLFDRTGNYSATFLTMAAAVVLALVVFFPVRVASRADGTGAS
ncbi:MAG TPA: MFS transporter [Steroidobacteraceae bacterium]|nr:MFS transporter [Steroidobacteraceae bacterium]